MAQQKQSDTSNRGFASMDEDKQREIAREGGESVPAEKRSFSKDPELAAEAGRKGGESVADEDRSFSKDPELAREAGRKAGKRRIVRLTTVLPPAPIPDHGERGVALLPLFRLLEFRAKRRFD